LNERARRLWAASEARELGWGGIAVVQTATGISHSTISKGIRQLTEQSKSEPLPVERSRRKGGGRKGILHYDPKIAEALESLIYPVTRGDPESPLRWTCKSTRRLADELTEKQLGKVIPYGVYDMESNEGWVSIGVNHDTAQSAAVDQVLPSAQDSTWGNSPESSVLIDDL